MRIGIDISQTAYENTGVGNYLSNLVSALLRHDEMNEYILFFSSLRREPSKIVSEALKFNSKATLRRFKIPPTILAMLWNNLHILNIESLLGNIDLFISSDWAEPPVKKAKKATIIYDQIIYKHPEETDQKIVSVQKRKLFWVKKESDIVFCISESTKKDAIEILGLNPEKVKVAYPGR